MNFLNALKNETHIHQTENGAYVYDTTFNAVYDLFAFGGAYRSRSDTDVIDLFQKAYNENSTYALKCLFYLRDRLEGAGERRFFRVCMKWLAANDPATAHRNMEHIAEYGRWDDLFIFFDTPIEKEMTDYVRAQLTSDRYSSNPSLLAKWMPSSNTSSEISKSMAKRFCKAWGWRPSTYRKTLSTLRSRIGLVENDMREQKWNEIQYDKLPSKAGMKYRKAFERHDESRYANFMQAAANGEAKVNARTLMPYEVIHEIAKITGYYHMPNQTDINTMEAYWSNLHDFTQGATFDGICVCDTSGSMHGTPMEVAVSLSLYCAEKAKGPYHNHFITFSHAPELQEIRGSNIVEKVLNLSRANWDSNTNIEAVFDLLLDTAIRNHCTQDDIMKNIIIVSDMEFDNCVVSNQMTQGFWGGYYKADWDRNLLFDTIEQKWAAHGYKMPSVVFWNVNARKNNAPMKAADGVTYVSGFSPAIFEALMSGKSNLDLMLSKLNSKRYEVIG